MRRHTLRLLPLVLGALALACTAEDTTPTPTPPVLADAAAADTTADAAVVTEDAAVLDAGPHPDATDPDTGPAASPDAGDLPDAAASVADAGLPGAIEVRPLATACPERSPAGATCRVLEVTCGGLEPVQVALHAYALPAGVAQRGVIVLGSGGGGTGLWSGPASADATVADLGRAGFLVLERQWLVDRERGWFANASGAGVPVAACRLTSLLRWIDAEYRRDAQPLCATGNSGGSAELAFAVLRAGAGAVLDLAVPSSGPFHRMDLACDGRTDRAWQTECAALTARNCPSCQNRGCSLGGGPRALIDGAYGMRTPCTGRSTPIDVPLLTQDSPLVPGLVLPQTKVVLLIGEQDPGGYAPLSAALYEGLAAQGVDVAFESEPATGHEFQSTEAGAERIEAVLLRECVRRH
jgi:hypothetical protein